MHYLSANAIRNEGMIQVSVSGFMSNSCSKAEIIDKYPGGNIVYFRDPGYAQVFIEETQRPGWCTQALVPWSGEVLITDDEHDSVEIRINDESGLQIPVKEHTDEFIVIALTSALQSGSHVGCSVVPESSLFIAIYSKVYGPDTKAKCEDFLAGNCAPIQGTMKMGDEHWPFPLKF